MPRNALITPRRDTAANWTSVNPVLAEGEIGWEKDTRAVKMGDGTTAWNALAYSIQPAAYAPVLNVTAYGAKGDGVTDDTIAFQAALNAANAAGGGCVYLPPTANFYKLTASLTVYSNTAVLGSWGAPIQMTGAWTGTTGCFVVNAAAVNVRFENLRVDCQKASKAAATNSRAFYIPNASHVRVVRCHITDPGTGGVDVSAGTDIGVSECYISGGGDGTTAARSHGIGFAGNTAPNLTNCFAQDNVIVGAYDTAIGLYTGVSDVSVVGNIIVQAAGLGPHGIDCDGPLRCSVADNIIVLSADSSDGIFIHPHSSGVAPAQDITIAGNVITGPGGHGISIFGNTVATINRICVVGNIMNHCFDGIYFAGPNGTPGITDCLISNNLIYNDADNGIFISQAGGAGQMTRNTFLNNLISGSAQWGINQAGVQTGNTIRGNVLVNNTAGAYTGQSPAVGAGGIAQPAVPATTVGYQNQFGVACAVYITGGTVTAIALDGVATGLTSGSFRVSDGQTITLTYTVAPTWKWFGD